MWLIRWPFGIRPNARVHNTYTMVEFLQPTPNTGWVLQAEYVTLSGSQTIRVTGVGTGLENAKKFLVL
jgi:hypothetical protein